MTGKRSGAEGEKKFIRILGHGDNEYDGEIVQTIICEGDAIGAVILLSGKEAGKSANLR